MRPCPSLRRTHSYENLPYNIHHTACISWYLVETENVRIIYEHSAMFTERPIRIQCLNHPRVFSNFRRMHGNLPYNFHHTACIGWYLVETEIVRIIYEHPAMFTETC
jgi:hypothetical protein